LRFNEVALLAVVSVRQSCHTSGGGWGRLTPTVSRAMRWKIDSLAKCGYNPNP